MRLFLAFLFINRVDDCSVAVFGLFGFFPITELSFFFSSYYALFGLKMGCFCFFIWNVSPFSVVRMFFGCCKQVGKEWGLRQQGKGLEYLQVPWRPHSFFPCGPSVLRGPSVRHMYRVFLLLVVICCSSKGVKEWGLHRQDGGAVPAPRQPPPFTSFLISYFAYCWNWSLFCLLCYACKRCINKG